MKIMIVDDEKDIGLILGTEFQGQGHDTVALTSVKEAIGYLQERPVDVIICEFEMPVQNGMSLFSWLRFNRPHIPFYFLPTLLLVFHFLKSKLDPELETNRDQAHSFLE